MLSLLDSIHFFMQNNHIGIMHFQKHFLFTSINKCGKSWFFVEKVLSLHQQIPPRFPLTSVPGRNFYFTYLYGIHQTTGRFSETVGNT